MNLKQQIENSIGELYQLIDGEHAEQDLQEWFERNPIVFDALGYSRVLPHPRLIYEGKQYIPDFMAQNSINLWEIIEIKTADANILKDTDRRHAFFSSTESNLSQCREYWQSFRDSACRNQFNSDYETNCHKTPDITMVIGRDYGFDRLLAHELLTDRSPKIKLVTYDDIANILSSRVEQVFGYVREEASGLFTACTVTILPTETDEAKYILDVCKRGTKNRIPLFTSENRIQVIATDDNGEFVKMKSTEHAYRKILGVHLEFCVQIENHANDSSIELLIDGALISESRIRGINFDFTGELDIVVGSDQNGHERSSMLMGGNIVIQAIPPLHEKWILRTFLNSINDGQGNFYVLEYIGHQFMHNCGHRILGNRMAYRGDLIQEDNVKKPIMRSVQ